MLLQCQSLTLLAEQPDYVLFYKQDTCQHLYTCGVLLPIQLLILNEKNTQQMHYSLLESLNEPQGKTTFLRPFLHVCSEEVAKNNVF